MVTLLGPLAFDCCELILRFACTILVCFQLTLLGAFFLAPHRIAVYIHLRASGVVPRAKAEHPRAGRIVQSCCDRIVVREVDDVLIRSHVAVVDLQRRLRKPAIA